MKLLTGVGPSLFGTYRRQMQFGYMQCPQLVRRRQCGRGLGDRNCGRSAYGWFGFKLVNSTISGAPERSLVAAGDQARGQP